MHEYLLPLLRNAASRGVEIWLLDGQSTDENQDMKSLIAENNSDVVKIHVLKSHHQNKIITAIVDKELCLTVEVRDTSDYEDENDASIEVLGLATYSNSESTILSYASIFETLWTQAELRSKTKKNI